MGATIWTEGRTLLVLQKGSQEYETTQSLSLQPFANVFVVVIGGKKETFLLGSYFLQCNQ